MRPFVEFASEAEQLELSDGEAGSSDGIHVEDIIISVHERSNASGVDGLFVGCDCMSVHSSESGVEITTTVRKQSS